MPGSHRFEMFPSKNYQEKNELQIEANIGDVFIFNSLLFHKAGANDTGIDRKLIVHMYTLPFVKQQVSFPKMLKGKHIDNEQLSYLIGYDSETEESVITWRERRKRRYDKVKK